MTPIELKRKELQDEIKEHFKKMPVRCEEEFENLLDITKDYQLDFTFKNNYLHGKYEGFNLGVEMGKAEGKKETAEGIFKDLEKLYKKYEEDGSPPVVCLPEDCGEIAGLSAVSEYWDIKKKWLKQSIEGEKHEI